MLDIEQIRAARVAEMRKSVEEASIEEWFDPRFGSRLTTEDDPAIGLRAFLRNPDSSALADAAKADPVLAAKLRENAQEATATSFADAEPAYLPSERNMHLLLRHIAREHDLEGGYRHLDDQELIERLSDEGLFTVAALRSAFAALAAAGRLEVKRGQPKALTAEEQRQVAATIAVQGVEAAIIQYLRFALGKTEQPRNPQDVLVQHPGICREASFFVFFNSEPGPVDSAAFRQYVQQRTQGKAMIVTLPILQALYREFEGQQRIAELPTEPEPKPVRPEDLSDAQIAELLSAERAARAAARPRRIG